MTSGEHSAELAVVVSTIGREREFRRLIRSVADSGVAERVEFVVVDQSPEQRCAAVAREQAWQMRVAVATSARGASLGRNAGLALSTAAIVLFPDDDAWYPPGSLAAILDACSARPDIAGLCGRQLTADGRPSMLRWQRRPGLVTARNFLRTSIMSTMVFRRSWLERVGPFDENMGVGSSSWYGACEESDLLLRIIEAGGEILYRPDIVVLQEEPRDDVDEAFVLKMLKYGCGQGHLWRKRRLSRWQLGYFLARKLVAASVRRLQGQRMLARADLAWLRGNLAGLRDVRPRALADQPRPVVPRPAGAQDAG